MLVNVFAYPISKNITNPERINGVLDKIDFETKFLDIFEAITISEIANQTGTTSEAVAEQISGDLISQEALRGQRVTAVNNFYTSIENKQVPIIKFEVENPVSKFTDNLEDTAENFFNSITNIQLCTDNQTSLFCNTFCGIFNCVADTGETQVQEEVEPNFVIESSLGITQENIEKVNMWYRIIKYGPDLLLVLSVALLLIGYISSFPNKKYALAMVWMGIQLALTAFVFWAAIPSVINLTSPIRIEPVTEVQGTVNSLLASSLTEISREAFIIPVVFLAVNVLAYIGLLLLERYRDANDGFESYDKKSSQKEETNGDISDDKKGDDKAETFKSRISNAKTVNENPSETEKTITPQGNTGESSGSSENSSKNEN